MIWKILMPPAQTRMHSVAIGVINGFIPAKHSIGQIRSRIDAQIPFVIQSNIIRSKDRKLQIEFTKKVARKIAMRMMANGDEWQYISDVINISINELEVYQWFIDRWNKQEKDFRFRVSFLI